MPGVRGAHLILHESDLLPYSSFRQLQLVRQIIESQYSMVVLLDFRLEAASIDRADFGQERMQGRHLTT